MSRHRFTWAAMLGPSRLQLKVDICLLTAALSAGLLILMLSPDFKSCAARRSSLVCRSCVAATLSVPKGRRPEAKKRSLGWEAQCGGGIWRGIRLVLVGKGGSSYLEAIMPPAQQAMMMQLTNGNRLLGRVGAPVWTAQKRICGREVQLRGEQLH